LLSAILCLGALRHKLSSDTVAPSRQDAQCDDNATYQPVNQTEYGSSIHLEDGAANGNFFTNFLNQSRYVFGDLSNVLAAW
jgi:hypothetical protein